MYKVLIVDDETQNYQLFEKLVDWGGKGFEISAYAADGLEALQKYDEVKPDLIFMDIQLPLMEGLECIRHIRKEDERVRIVIVSAYGDFSYAQKAIQYGVQDFLLKPVSRLMLNQLVDKMKAALENEASAALKINEGEDWIRDLERVIRGGHDGEMEARLRDMDYCGVILTNGDGGYISDTGRRGILGDLMKNSSLHKYPAAEYTLESGHSLIILQKRETAEAFIKCFQASVREAGYLCQIYVHNRAENSIKEWIRLFAGVENYGFYSLECGIYKVEESPFTEEEIQLKNLEQTVAQAVAEGSCEQLLDMLEQLYQEAAGIKINPRILKNMSLDSLVRIKFMLKKFDRQDSFSLMRNIRMESIHNMQNVNQLKMFVTEKIKSTFADISALYLSSGKKLVFRANAFTENSYQEVDFSVQKVADYIGISKNYFTSQYKELTGSGFWEYVTKLRMEKAKELLVMTDEMVGNIAHEVGYDSEYHFSRKFKEYTGESPKNFRKSVENSK